MVKYRKNLFVLLSAIAVIILGLLIYFSPIKKIKVDEFEDIPRSAKIHPDYNETVIPPNIAPLNFVIQEDGECYFIKIFSKNGKSIEVFSPGPEIIIPQKKWHSLLNSNKNEKLCFDIFVKAKGGSWKKFTPFNVTIAAEPIDTYLVYRRFHPTHHLINGQLGIYQRNLSTYEEKAILVNEYLEKNGCVNCHSFRNNRTDKVLMGTRSPIYGNNTLLIENRTVKKIDAKLTYTSWHPTGRIAAFSINNVNQFFHSVRNEIRDAVDLDSTIVYYNDETKTLKTSGALSRKDRLETYPTWSEDGRFLYFCSAPLIRDRDKRIPPLNYKQSKYDLVRVSYDCNSDAWGETETVVSSEQTGLSALLPRISPDGRWLLLCLCDCGCFPAFNQTSDLYMFDLQAFEKTGKGVCRLLDINSKESESWHCWSSNSRWIVFSSKRDYGLFTRLYISYVDINGNVHKPLLLPQKDPAFYDSCLQTYNTPELIVEPMTVKAEKLAAVVRGSRKIPVDIPVTMATPKAPASVPDTQTNQQE